MKPHAKKKSKLALVAIALLALLVTLGFSGVYLWVVRTLWPCLDDSGKFGDTFGGLNALFTGCAFLVVYFTFLQQSHDTQQTRAIMMEAAELQARVARIEALNVQIAEARRNRDEGLAKRLTDQRRTHLIILDQRLDPEGTNQPSRPKNALAG